MVCINQRVVVSWRRLWSVGLSRLQPNRWRTLCLHFYLDLPPPLAALRVQPRTLRMEGCAVSRVEVTRHSVRVSFEARRGERAVPVGGLRLHGASAEGRSIRLMSHN